MPKLCYGLTASLVLLLSSCHLFQTKKEIEELPSNHWFDEQVSYLDTVFSQNDSLCGQKTRVLNHFEPFCFCESIDSVYKAKNLRELEYLFIQQRIADLARKGYLKQPYQELLDMQGMTMKLPSDFKIVRHNKDFVWMRNVLKKHDVHLYIYKTNYHSKSQFEPFSITKLRDSLSQVYFVGSKYDTTSYAQTEKHFEVESYQDFWKNSYAKRYQGVWALVKQHDKKSVLAGPFVGYAIVPNNEPNHFYYIEAFFSAPNHNKLPFIRTLDAILSTFEYQPYEQRF
ncbi:DUF4837 family protein [Cyclobacteriaceae bacterium]|nr:DUF4837 family protein [Cyclobacteriaceae bacterium]